MMDQYFGLLRKIAGKYNIRQGEREEELSWKARVVYSLLGQIGYASLYDRQEDGRPATIVHFKNRINDSLWHFLCMYPELERVFSSEDASLAEELYALYLGTGCIYHEPDRIRPCREKQARGKDCIFMRGQAVGGEKWISGAGNFTLSGEVGDRSMDMPSVGEMFLLPRKTLREQWEDIVSRADFRELPADVPLEHLRTSPPYKNGYWGSREDRSGNISLARTALQGERIYYLYRADEKNRYISQLPGWMTGGALYRSVAAAGLAVRGTLPETVFWLDGPIVTLRIGYLFPPAELGLIKLYSWPVRFCELPSDFTRVMQRDVFCDLKKILEGTGYQFREEE